MRDLLLLVILLASVPVVLYRPWVGILLWYWVGLMNPHRLTWGFMYDFQIAMLVAVVTLVGLIIAKDREPPPFTREVFLLCAFGAWVTMTTYFAWVPDAAWEYWQQFMKILLFTVLTPILIHGRRRVELLFIVVAGSIAFYGLKGGVHFVSTGGGGHVLGPARSFISGNTNLGLALVMVLPLVLVLSRQFLQGRLTCLPTWRWSRFAGWGGYATFWFTTLAILGTYSRGAFLGLVAVAPFILLKMQRKVLFSIVALFAVFVIGVTVPDRVVERAETIQAYEEDNSAMSRLQAWNVNWNIAAENPLTGAGFSLVLMGNERWLSYADFEGDWRRTARAAHSIYFQVIGHHGFVGLGIYLALLGAVVATLCKLMWRARRSTETVWISEYAWALLIGIVGYAVAGAFLDMAYFTLFYAFVGLTIILRREYMYAVGEQRVVNKVNLPTVAEADSSEGAQPGLANREQSRI